MSNTTDLGGLSITIGNATFVAKNNTVTDQQLGTGFRINAILGAVCLIAFCILQAVTAAKFYRNRLTNPSVTYKPPQLPFRTFSALWSWLKVVILASDWEILQTAGLDGLVMVKAMLMGFQLLAPMALLGCAVTIPLNSSQSGLPEGAGRIMRYSLANVANSSPVLWVHWVFANLYMFYAMGLLYWHYKQYVIARQHFLLKGDDNNQWQGLLGDKSRQEQKALDFINIISRGATPKHSEGGQALGEGQERGSPPSTRYDDGVELGLVGPRPVRTRIDGNGGEGVLEPPLVDTCSRDNEGDTYAVAANWWEKGSGNLRRSMLHRLKPEATDMLLNRPSVRYRKTVNTVKLVDGKYQQVALYAQHYAVLVTDVGQAVFPGNARHVEKAMYKSSALRSGSGDDIPTWFLTIEELIGQYMPSLGAWINRVKYPFKKRRARMISQSSGIPIAEGVMPQALDIVVEPEGSTPSPGYSCLSSPGQSSGTGQASTTKACAPPGPASDELSFVLRPRNLPASGGGPPRDLWGKVRSALAQGQLLALLDKEEYSIVTATFRREFPKDYDRAIPVLNHLYLDELMWKRELLQARLLRLAQDEARTGRPPMTRTPGCCGAQVEAQPELCKELNAVEREIVEERKNGLSRYDTSSWLVFFKSQRAAAVAASINFFAEASYQFQVHPAPGPEEMNWPILWMTHTERTIRAAVVKPFQILVVIVPVTLLVGMLSSVDTAFCIEGNRLYWEAWCAGSPDALVAFLKRAVTGWLPSILLSLYQLMLLPRLIFWIAQSEAQSFSLSALDRRMGDIYFQWDVFNVFLGGVLGSNILTVAEKILQDPGSTITILGQQIPSSCNFFMQFVALRALFLIPLRFLLPHGGVWMNWVRYIFCAPCCCSFCHTQRDEAMLFSAKSPRYGLEMGQLLLVLVVSLALAVVAPLVLPWGCLYFAMCWILWRYFLLYVNCRKYESGGIMWPYLFHRICYCLAIFLAFTFIMLVVKLAWIQAALLAVVQVPALLRFRRYTVRRFGAHLRTLPMDLASRAPRARVDPWMYTPPPLREGGIGWHPEWMKVWEGWGMPAYPCCMGRQDKDTENQCCSCLS